MKGFIKNIEDISIKNEEFRQVLYTAENIQLVVMSLKPKEEIGMEIHELDQFFRVEEGTGEAVLDGERVRRCLRGFAQISARALPCSFLQERITTSSIRGVFH